MSRLPLIYVAQYCRHQSAGDMGKVPPAALLRFSMTNHFIVSNLPHCRIIAEARKFGGCFVLGFQKPQMEEIYGPKAPQGCLTC